MADPIAKFRKWFKGAKAASVPIPEAMALATADNRGRPSVRYVLLKGVDPDGSFVFYTNSHSRKGRELSANPYASLAFYWDATGQQVRVEGKLQGLAAAAADLYWASRPRGSQLASAVSSQSRELDDRRDLVTRYRTLERSLAGSEVPRPAHWLGYRVRPERIEFWTRREPRLHHRELFVRRGQSWRRTLLEP